MPGNSLSGGFKRLPSQVVVTRSGSSDRPLGTGPASRDSVVVPLSNGPFIGTFFLIHVKTAMPSFQRLSTVFNRTRLVATGLFAGLIFTVGPAHGEEAPGTSRWVSDNLSTFVRSGPTDGYRIVGSLKSGQKVELLSTQGDYSQVRGEGGSSVWIPSSDLQPTPGPAEHVPLLTQQVADLSGKLQSIDDSWKNRVQGMQETLDSRKALIDELEARSKALSAELSDAQSELRSTQAKSGDENKHVMMSYMVYGGSIAGAGLLAGLILPMMTRGRKRNDRWF